MRKYIFIFVVLCAGLIGLIALNDASARTHSSPTVQSELCGNASETDNYGFTYNLQQPHWTVNWEGYISEDTVIQVDVILDRLNNDSIAQTMILFKPQAQVGNRVNCAVHFLRYMKLGLPQGERKDNGFVFLIVVEDSKIDVHYGVGLGLPGLTAQGLTPLNRLAEQTYQSTTSLDQSLLTLVKAYDEYVRGKYAPLSQPEPTPIVLEGASGTAVLCCVLCLIALVILLLIYATMSGVGRGGRFGGGGGGGWGSFPTSFPSGGGIGSILRCGGGSGRSARGN